MQSMLATLAFLYSDLDNDAIQDAYFHQMEIAAIEGESSDEDEGSLKDSGGNSPEHSNWHPEVKWVQRLDKVYLTVQLAGAKNINVKLTPEGIFTVSATVGADKNSREWTLKLHDKVNVEESKIDKGVGNIFCLIEKKKQGWWRKLLSGDEEAPHYVKVDWDRWVDEGQIIVANTTTLDLFSKTQPSVRTKKGKSRKTNLEAEQELRNQKSQKTLSKPISSAHKKAAHTPSLPPPYPTPPRAPPSFSQGRSSTRVIPNQQLVNNTLTQVRSVLESRNFSLPTDDLLQQHIANTSMGAAAAVQLVQTIKGLNGEIKAKDDELKQLRKEAQMQKAQLEIEKNRTQSLYMQESMYRQERFKQEKAELMKNFEREREETKAKYEAVADDIFYQVWRNNRGGNFSFLGEDVKKVIAGFKKRLKEEAAFDNEASEEVLEKVVEEDDTIL